MTIVISSNNERWIFLLKNRVGIYTRLSDEDRFKKNKVDDSESIANQKSMLLKYALNHQWEVYNVYSDDDWSGMDINRPQFQRLINDCQNGKIDIVLCKTQSRFSRDMEIIEKYIHNKFVEWGIRFVSVVDNADTLVLGNKKTRQINGLINEWYLEDLSNNIRSSLQSKREDGLFLGSFAPYGYIKDPNNKNKLLIDPVASAVIKDIYNMFKSGVGYYKIAKHLSENGILTPSNYKKENGSKYVCGAVKGKNNTKWSQDTIARILKNEVYIGNLVQGKKTYISYKNHKTIVKPKEQWTISYKTHEPIIDIETWSCVQSIIKSRVRPCRTIGEIYMFSKKVYCKDCGSSFNRQIYITKDGKTSYMKCKGSKKDIGCTNKASIRCDELEQIVLNEINNQINKFYNYDDYNKLYKFQKKHIEDSIVLRKDSLLLEKEKIQEKINNFYKYYQSLYKDKLDGIITIEDFIIFKDKFSKDIEKYKKRINLIDVELIKINKKKRKIPCSPQIVKGPIQLKKLNKEIIDKLIDVIFVGGINQEKNEREINIEINSFA